MIREITLDGEPGVLASLPADLHFSAVTLLESGDLLASERIELARFSTAPPFAARGLSFASYSSTDEE